MEAACRGARQAGGLTVGLLPGERAEDGNEFLVLAVPTGLGEARNVLVVGAGDSVIAIGGGLGTLSEIAHARRLGKPVLGLGTWQATARLGRNACTAAGVLGRRGRGGGAGDPAMTDRSGDAGLELARSIVDVLDAHKGEDIVLLDLHEVCGFADYFVLCTGVSDRTLRALAEEVVKAMKGRQVHARGQEGKASSGWILLDYGDVIAHLFSKSVREYYRLEDVWRAGKMILRVQ